MSKELYLYTGIYDFTAQDLISQIEAYMGEEINLRVTSPGGSVFAANGIAAKISEHGNVNIKVDGCAMSSAANILPYGKNVECLDVSKFTLHRAEIEVTCTEDQIFIDAINKDLKAKLLLKVDPLKFKKVTGYTIDDMFNPAQRINIQLSAEQAKAIGLVDKINPLSPKEATALNAKLYRIAAVVLPEEKEKFLIPKNKKMDLIQLKAEHPATYNEAIALGKAEAIAQEQDRVGAWMKFNGDDPKAVAEGVASGKILSQTQMLDFILKKTAAPAALAAIESVAAPVIVTPVAGSVTTPVAVDAAAVAAAANLKAFREEANKMTAQAGVKLSV